AAALLACGLGCLAGGSLALAPRTLRETLARGLDFFLAFPSLILAFALAAVLGPGWGTLLLALASGALPPFVRLAYARAREVTHEEYVLAARSLGASTGHVLFRHVGPEILELCRVKLPNLFAHALLAEATLSFLGVGVPLGEDSWGTLLLQGKDFLVEAPHVALASGLPLVLTVAALQRLSQDRSPRRSGILGQV
ncbi:MAG TPA: ABC transporter permease subunit, partial [Bdellovibrionota bacterium]|nr:ABC transporter permease subunit [Bdellovibrionota bacterium]